MKKYLLIATLYSCTMATINAQSCRRIDIDSAQQKILNQYIQESDRGHYFVNDKGIVVVTRFVNESGRPAWAMKVLLDDGYKDNPPYEWVQLGRDVVLFYNATSRYNVEKTTATPELLKCLDEAIGDRLYVRPPKRDRWMDVPGPNGKTMKVRANRITTGSSNNETVIIFEADGKIKTLKSV